jgi:hypothetical protein
VPLHKALRPHQLQDKKIPSPSRGAIFESLNAPSSPSAGRFQFPASRQSPANGLARLTLSHQPQALRAYLVDSLRSAAIVPHGCSDEEDAAGRLRRSISREYLNDAQMDDLHELKSQMPASSSVK